MVRRQGYQTTSYHAGLGASDRRTVEASWLSGEIHFVVCTCAFGMGINKADVRWVAHFHPPFLLSEYVQEIGRAGRDGNLSEVLLLMSEPTGLLNPGDKLRQKFFQEQMRSHQQKAQQLVKKLPKQGDIDTVVRKFAGGAMLEDGVAIALSLLHSSGQLAWIDPFHYEILPKFRTGGLTQLSAIKQMNKYLTTRQCRWQFLLSAFGFNQEAINWRCGHCDNCRATKSLL